MPSENQYLSAFVQLGKILGLVSEKKDWPGFSCGLSESEYKKLVDLTRRVYSHNNWFTSENVLKSFSEIANMLQEESLITWLSAYRKSDKILETRVATIMAGNIPLVGFHDFLCVVLGGFKAKVKLSSQDNLLLPALVELLEKFTPGFSARVEFMNGRLGDFDAVIATGSDNSSRYFDFYFGKYPHIIRRNRNSVAVITHKTSDEDMMLLGEDVFAYFGLGCRNVSKVYIEQGVDINRLIGAFYSFNEVVHNKKYGNNYDYNRAIYMLNKIPFLDNGFMIFKEDKSLASPVSVLHYEYFSEKPRLDEELSSLKDKIQCVVGEGYIPFGKAQCPELSDYADGVDTMAFLEELK